MRPFVHDHPVSHRTEVIKRFSGSNKGIVFYITGVASIMHKGKYGSIWAAPRIPECSKDSPMAQFQGESVEGREGKDLNGCQYQFVLRHLFSTPFLTT